MPTPENRVGGADGFGIAQRIVPPDRGSQLLPDPLQGLFARFDAEVLLLFPAGLLADGETEKIKAFSSRPSDGFPG